MALKGCSVEDAPEKVPEGAPFAFRVRAQQWWVCCLRAAWFEQTLLFLVVCSLPSFPREWIGGSGGGGSVRHGFDAGKCDWIFHHTECVLKGRPQWSDVL